MKRSLLAGAAVALALAASGCGGSGSSQDPTAEISACLSAAGARRAATPSDLRFAEPWAVTREGFHPDHSGTLSVGAYHGRGSGGWAVYYVARKGYRVSLASLRRQPSKAAKVVAYVHPKNGAAMQAAGVCLKASKP